MSFGERLSDACKGAGIFAASELAQRVGVSTLEAQAWLAMSEPPEISWALAIVLCKTLRVRHVWLYAGEGVQSAMALNGQETEVLRVLDGLTRRQIARWIAIGRELTKG